MGYKYNKKANLTAFQGSVLLAVNRETDEQFDLIVALSNVSI